jgi:hypothetical protein
LHEASNGIGVGRAGNQDLRRGVEAPSVINEN